MITRRATLALPLLATPAIAQAGFPSRPLVLMIPFAAGGPTDMIARLMAEFQHLHAPLRIRRCRRQHTAQISILHVVRAGIRREDATRRECFDCA